MTDEPTEEDRAEFDRVTREAANDTYRIIGKCITAWSGMEGLLVGIAAMLLDTQREKTGLILYSINNFHTWLSIIEELFALDPRYTPLRPDWIKISSRLKKCNDIRVSLAHHALVPGKGIEHLAGIDDDDFTSMFPTLRPNRFDTRARSRKHRPLGPDELMTFGTDLSEVRKMIGELIDKISPIFLEQRKSLTESIKELNEAVREMNAHRAAIRSFYGG